MDIQGLHHVAYRCRDAARTVDFYSRVLGLEYSMAVAEDRVPSTGEQQPYMHIFFEMGDGSSVAFFELPEEKPMGRDDNTPAWVQHLALKVADEKTLLANKARLESHGVNVLGPIEHGICKSIYFFDPDGHRLELACDTSTAAMNSRLRELSKPMLEEWNRTKRAPKLAAFVHENTWNDR